MADFDPVTPSRALMAYPDGSLPQVVYPRTEILCLQCWQHSQVLADQLCSSFIRDYLPGLQTRQKWQRSPSVLQDNTAIMFLETQLLRAQWPIGRAVRSHHSDDGCISSANVNIKGHIFT